VMEFQQIPAHSTAVGGTVGIPACLFQHAHCWNPPRSSTLEFQNDAEIVATSEDCQLDLPGFVDFEPAAHDRRHCSA